jgi:hypothetical protein
MVKFVKVVLLQYLKILRNNRYGFGLARDDFEGGDLQRRFVIYRILISGKAL